MKKIITPLCIAFAAQLTFAQSNKTTAVTTKQFTDSLKTQIKRIIPVDFGIKLLYTSAVSAEGKLLKPLIWRQINKSDGSNTFVVKLRELLIAAPAWKPAFDTALNKDVDDEVLFTVIIHKGQVNIEKTEKTELK